MAGSGTNRIAGVETIPETEKNMIILYIAKVGGLKINSADSKSAKLPNFFFRMRIWIRNIVFFPYKFADLRTGTLSKFGDLRFAD
jgi:hypothetical protein